MTRTVGARRTIEEEPVVIDLIVSGGRLPLPSGYIEDDLLPKPAAMVSGRRRTEVHISARFARRGRKVLPPPRIVVSDPLGLATRVVTAEDPAELLVLPRLEKVVTPPGEGDGSGLAARRGRPSIAAEVDLDGLRPYRPGAAASRIFWPGAGARRRAHGAPPALRRRHAAADRARPAPSRARGGPRRGGARHRLAVRAPGARRRLRAAAARRPAPDGHRVRRSSAGRTCTCAWRWSTIAPGPNVGRPGVAPGAAALRGRPPSGARAARAGPRRRRRALPHRAGRRRPARRALRAWTARVGGRRAAFTVAGCTGYELSGTRRVAEVA